jgi:methyl coenzyme M reductase alpha subunit
MAKSFLNRLLEINPLAITYNAEVISLTADHYEVLVGSETKDVSSIRRSGRLILRCGDESAQRRWSTMRKQTSMVSRLRMPRKAPEAFVKDFTAAEKNRARRDFKRAIELDSKVRYLSSSVKG